MNTLDVAHFPRRLLNSLREEFAEVSENSNGTFTVMSTPTASPHFASMTRLTITVDLKVGEKPIIAKVTLVRTPATTASSGVPRLPDPEITIIAHEEEALRLVLSCARALDNSARAA